MAKKNTSAELGLLIMNAGRLLHQKMQATGIGPVSMLRFKILRFIGERGPTAMKDLAGFLGVTAPSATVLVNRLTRTGELARVASRGDRRSVNVKITKLGQRTLSRDQKALIGRMGLILSCLRKSEVNDLTVILKNLLKK
jgi:DNA-binding MarR family transcriptional regulator